MKWADAAAAAAKSSFPASFDSRREDRQTELQDDDTNVEEEGKEPAWQFAAAATREVLFPVVCRRKRAARSHVIVMKP